MLSVNARSESVPTPTLNGMSGALKHLCDVNHKIVEFLQTEYKRKMTLQTYIGEAVLYELLCQSYGVPEYTTEEKHKRLLSVILGAIKNHQNRPACSLDTVDILDGLWNRPDDPHNLDTVIPDTGAIRLRKIVEDTTTKQTEKTPDLKFSQPIAEKPIPVISVQINGKYMGHFEGTNSPNKDEQKALDIALPIIKKRRKKVKQTIRSGTTFNFVL